MRDYLDEYIVATRLIHRTTGASIEELAEALDKTPRAVYQLLAKLDYMFPIYSKPDPYHPRKQRYHADAAFAEYLPALEFTDEDKAVYNYLVSSIDNHPDLRKDASRLFNKLRLLASEHGALLEEGYNKTVPIVISPVVRHKSDEKQTSKVASALIDAINKKQWIDILVQFVEDNALFDWKCLFPIELVMTGGVLNLLALNKMGHLWEISVCLIKDVTNVFADPAPEDLTARKADIAARLQDPFGFELEADLFEVKAAIAKEIVPYIKANQWPDSVKFEDQEDGSTIMTAQTRNIAGFKTWVMMKSPHIKVLKPFWLVQSIIDTCRNTFESHEQILKENIGEETRRCLVVRTQKRSPKLL